VSATCLFRDGELCCRPNDDDDDDDDDNDDDDDDGKFCRGNLSFEISP
jgi:hypothetical protein